MEIEIKKLDFEHIDDYLAFFDQVAFGDHGEWDGCYCTYYHFNRMEAEKYENDPNRKVKLRKKAIEFIRKKLLQGYLAYFDEKVVGWVNVSAKQSYPAIMDTPELASKDDARIKSIVCFIVAPALRHQGIATMLLNRALEDAKDEGFLFVEAYPNITNGNCYVNYHGYRTMFERSGFKVTNTLSSLLVMQKPL